MPGSRVSCAEQVDVGPGQTQGECGSQIAPPWVQPLAKLTARRAAV